MTDEIEEDNSAASKAESEVANKMLGDLLPGHAKPKEETRTYGGDWRRDFKRGDYGSQADLWDERGYYGGHGSGYGTSYGGGRQTRYHGRRPRADDWEGGDDLDDVLPMGGSRVKGHSGGGSKGEPTLPYWISRNIKDLQETLRDAGNGERPLRARDTERFAMYLMLAFGDLLEKAAGLTFMTDARKMMKAAIVEAVGGLCLTVGGQTRRLETGEDVPKDRYTGPVAEQVLTDALRLAGFEDDATVVAVTDYLRQEGVRLVTSEDVEDELVRAEGEIVRQQAEIDKLNDEIERMSEKLRRADFGRPNVLDIAEQRAIQKITGGPAPVRSAIGRTMEQEIADERARSASATSDVGVAAAAPAPVGGGSIFDDDGEEEEGFMAPGL